jgi:hypothetical protein
LSACRDTQLNDARRVGSASALLVEIPTFGGCAPPSGSFIAAEGRDQPVGLVRQVAAFGDDFNDIANRRDEFRLILGARRQATAECRYDASGGILTSRPDISIRSIRCSSVDKALATALGVGSRIAASLQTGRVVNRTARCRRISRRRPLSRRTLAADGREAVARRREAPGDDAWRGGTLGRIVTARCGFSSGRLTSAISKARADPIRSQKTAVLGQNQRHRAAGPYAPLSSCTRTVQIARGHCSILVRRVVTLVKFVAPSLEVQSRGFKADRTCLGGVARVRPATRHMDSGLCASCEGRIPVRHANRRRQPGPS